MWKIIEDRAGKRKLFATLETGISGYRIVCMCECV